MSDIHFPEHDRQVLERQAFHGERAKEVKEGDDWKWLVQYIFGAMEDQATHTLINAKTEEERVKAQQMFLASRKPGSLLDALISQGDAARASLAEYNKEATLDMQTEELNHA